MPRATSMLVIVSSLIRFLLHVPREVVSQNVIASFGLVGSLFTLQLRYRLLVVKWCDCINLASVWYELCIILLPMSWISPIVEKWQKLALVTV